MKQVLNDALRALVYRQLGFHPSELENEHAELLRTSGFRYNMYTALLLFGLLIIGAGAINLSRTNPNGLAIITMLFGGVILLIGVHGLSRTEPKMDSHRKQQLELWWRIESLMRPNIALIGCAASAEKLSTELIDLAKWIINDLRSMDSIELVLTHPPEHGTHWNLNCILRLLIHLKLVDTGKLKFVASTHTDLLERQKENMDRMVRAVPSLLRDES